MTWGAAHVIGVDGARDFIDLAKQRNKDYEGKIDYFHGLIQNFQGHGDRDIVIGSYVLSYPKNLDEAIAYCKSIAQCLTPDGQFNGFNNNPFEVFNDTKHAKYSFEKEMHGDMEGEKVIYKVSGMDNPIVNFYLKPETYERAFKEAGFSKFEWRRVSLNPDNSQEEAYWDDFFTGEPPFISMLARK